MALKFWPFNVRIPKYTFVSINIKSCFDRCTRLVEEQNLKPFIVIIESDPIELWIG